MEKYTPYRLISLILAKLTGSSNSEEEKQLEEWLNESAKHRALFEKLTDRKALENYRMMYSEHDEQAGYLEFCRWMRRERRIRLFRRTGWVAAVLFPLVFALSIWVNRMSQPEVTPIATSAIRPGSPCAVLTLPDGKRILLDSVTPKTGTLGVGMIAVKDTLAYQRLPERQVEYHTLYVPRGGEYVLKLSDGTKVWLNAETELKYPPVFDSRPRKVFLKGEAYFEVAKNESSPFIIESGEHVVRVLGTSFGIRAYPEEKEISTTLEYGSVKVMTSGQEVLLTPGKQSRVDLLTHRLRVKEVNTSLYTAWHSGKFIFIDQSLEDILNTLSRWYNMEIFYACSDLKEIQFTGELKRYAEIHEFLQYIEHLEKVRFTIQGKTVTVSQY